MKNALIITGFLLLIASCKKDEISQSIKTSESPHGLKNKNEYLQNVKKYLKDSLSNTEFKNLDFKKSSATKFDRGNIYLLRIQFKRPGNEFVLIRTDSLGNCSKGMILNINYSNNV